MELIRNKDNPSDIAIVLKTKNDREIISEIGKAIEIQVEFPSLDMTKIIQTHTGLNESEANTLYSELIDEILTEIIGVVLSDEEGFIVDLVDRTD